MIERLSLMARGIANSTVSSYARMFLVHTVIQVAPNDHELITRCSRQNYEEFLTSYKYHYTFEAATSGGGSYDEIFGPAIKWFVGSQVRGLPASDPKRDLIIKRCFNEIDNIGHPSPVIVHLLEVASPNFIAGKKILFRRS